MTPLVLLYYMNPTSGHLAKVDDTERDQKDEFTQRDGGERRNPV
ncbi:hypothetical protein EYZ11_012269 [Aspergillus tanneri]|uniref:Uncharacterized protein n=1 Tax=Aspergillus tanneri TaxID=1220188 RepID=A0A4S3J0N5_9EURO|nr:hypothetical protein EYZ11_012269 [Aspergillus tanneri]